MSEFKFKIPDIIKYQVKNNLGSIDICYESYSVKDNETTIFKVKKEITLTLTVFTTSCHAVAQEVFFYDESNSGSFDKWFEKISKQYDIVGEVNE